MTKSFFFLFYFLINLFFLLGSVSKTGSGRLWFVTVANRWRFLLLFFPLGSVLVSKADFWLERIHHFGLLLRQKQVTKSFFIFFFWIFWLQQNSKYSGHLKILIVGLSGTRVTRVVGLLDYYTLYYTIIYIYMPRVIITRVPEYPTTRQSKFSSVHYISNWYNTKSLWTNVG